MKTNVSIIDYLPTYDLASAFKEIQQNPQFDIARFNKLGQCCINTNQENYADHFYGCGSALYDWDISYYDETLGELIVPKRDTPIDSSTFTLTSSIFIGTIFDTVLADLKRYYTVGRVRIMQLYPKTCLSWHTDSTNRIHYPIKTQTGCLMIFDNDVHHLSENTWYFTKTKNNYHTAINASKEIRYHLVVEILMDNSQ